LNALLIEVTQSPDDNVRFKKSTAFWARLQTIIIIDAESEKPKIDKIRKKCRRELDEEDASQAVSAAGPAVDSAADSAARSAADFQHHVADVRPWSPYDFVNNDC
jgi:hypothetical protein